MRAREERVEIRERNKRKRRGGRGGSEEEGISSSPVCEHMRVGSKEGRGEHAEEGGEEGAQQRLSSLCATENISIARERVARKREFTIPLFYFLNFIYFLIIF